MAEIASAFVSLLPSAKGFGSKLDSEISGDLNASGKKAGGTFGKVFAVGAAAAIGGALVVGKFLKDSIGEAREAQKVGALTESIIKSTGKAAGITADQVGAMSGRLSSMTGIDDEVIQGGANLLLTFKNVKNYVDGEFVGVFDRATAAAVDLSAAGFGSVEGASKQLGKALNDPVKGISALSRSGVTFTEQQQGQIKALVAGGEAAKAQAIILGEVESQVGGAAAAASTYGEKAAVAFGNIKEQVGTALLPVIDNFFKLFLGTVPTITKLIDGIGPAFGKVKGFITPIVGQVKAAFAAFGGAGATLNAVKDSFSTIGDAIRNAFGGNGGGLSAAVTQLQSFASTVGASVLPFITRLGAIFRETVIPAFTTFATTVVAQVAPVLKTMATTFQTTLLPAISSLVGYVASALFPIFQKVANIVTTQVIPIIGKLAEFFYGTLYPAVIDIVKAVAKNLKPVFDQLVETFKSQVLPTISKLLDKFEEYRPTIQKVIVQVVKIVGKVLEFAATILGKVLPPVIKFAGYLIANVVPAVADVIGIIVKIISKVIDFGGAMIDGVKKVAKFAQGVGEKIGDVITFFRELPGKVLGFITGLGTDLFNAGGKLVTMLANGIKAKAQEAINALKGIADKLKGLLPGSPIKWGPLKNWNNGGAGKRLMDLVARGITAGGKGPLKAAEEAFGKIGKSLEKQRDSIKSTLDGLKGDFQSLAESVSSAFVGDLFGVTATEAVAATEGTAAVAGRTVGQNFIDNLMGKKAELTGLLASFKTLTGWGIPASFLSQLFASGNGGLITELAGMGQAGATSTASLFGEVVDLGAQLGNAVAQNDPVASAIDNLGPKLDEVNGQLKFLNNTITPKLEAAVKQGAKEGTKEGNDDRAKKAHERKKAGR